MYYSHIDPPELQSTLFINHFQCHQYLWMGDWFFSTFLHFFIKKMSNSASASFTRRIRNYSIRNLFLCMYSTDISLKKVQNIKKEKNQQICILWKYYQGYEFPINTTFCIFTRRIFIQRNTTQFLNSVCNIFFVFFCFIPSLSRCFNFTFSVYLMTNSKLFDFWQYFYIFRPNFQ